MTQVGDTINNHYRILSKIGADGFTDTWLANLMELNMLCSITEIKYGSGVSSHDNRTALPASYISWVKESTDRMSRLDHPNIANVIDCLDDGSSIYIVRCYILTFAVKKGRLPSMSWANGLVSSIVFCSGTA